MAHDKMAPENRLVSALPCLCAAGIMLGRDQTPMTLFKARSLTVWRFNFWSLVIGRDLNVP